MVNAGITGVLIFALKVLEFTDDGEAQVALEFITTETMSPFASVLVENTGELVPAFIPFIFH
jgi:hypothetical protein